jgi:hypothetical protein
MILLFESWLLRLARKRRIRLMPMPINLGLEFAMSLLVGLNRKTRVAFEDSCDEFWGFVFAPR